MVDETAITLRLRPLRRHDRYRFLAHWRVAAAASVVAIAAAAMLFIERGETARAELAPRIRFEAVARPSFDAEPVLASSTLPVLEPMEPIEIDEVVILEDDADAIVILDDVVEPPPAKTSRTARRARARGVARIHLDNGETARSMGDLAAAKREFEAALTALPSYAPAAAALAEVHMKQRSYRTARRYAKRASRSAPRKLDYMLLLGDAYFLTGDRSAAKNVWRKAAAYGSAKAKSRLAT